MTIAFSAGACRGRSPGSSNVARASNSLSASWRVRSNTSAPPAIDPIVSTSDSRKRASLVSSSLRRLVPPALGHDQVRGDDSGERDREREGGERQRVAVRRECDDREHGRGGKSQNEQSGSSR